jgi:hypothetical protein
VPTSSRILFHLSRLTVAVSAANLLRWRAAASSGYGWALKSAPRRQPPPCCCTGAREGARSGLCRPPPGYFPPVPVRDGAAQVLGVHALFPTCRLFEREP